LTIAEKFDTLQANNQTNGGRIMARYKRSEMEKILRDALPSFEETGVLVHLRHVTAPKEGKGKILHFQWRRRLFRMTASLGIKEFLFGDVPHMRDMTGDTELTTEIKDLIQKQIA